MIAVDTNILVAAHRRDAAMHHRALQALQSLCGSKWAIPWPCVHEFVAVVTHPRIFADPTPLAVALSTIRDLLSSGNCRLLAEGDSYLDRLEQVATRMSAQGPRIHDARVAAICLAQGVHELWTADRDFLRVTGLRIRNPLREAAPDPVD